MSSNDRFAGKTAIVTGGASGIGAAIARGFGSQGGSVVVTDVDERGAEEVAREIGPNALAKGVDVRNEREVEGAIEVAVEQFGGLDAAFNVAGLNRTMAITDQTVEDWDLVLDIDLRGAMLGVKHQARQMISQNAGGAIVNVSSVASHAPIASCAAYCCAKAAVAMLTKVTAIELGSHNIRVNCIAPGLVKTPLAEPLWDVPGLIDAFNERTALGRHTDPEELASAALFLVSNEASYITGTELVVDGGLVLQGHPDTRSLIAELGAALNQGDDTSIVKDRSVE